LKRVLIGGSGSTGSSLLNNVLGRNPNIITTLETSIFCKKPLYNNFNFNKWRIPFRFPFGLPNWGYHLYRKTDYKSLYLKKNTPFSSIMLRSRNFMEFADNLFLSMEGYGGEFVWIEKTPANSFHFDQFLDYFANSFVIHTIRNPYDTLASLLERGYPDIYAGGIYLLNTLAGMKSRDSANYYEVRYEDFTSYPEKSLKHILDFLGLNYSGNELKPDGKHYKEANIVTWKKDELGEVEKNTGRFLNSSQEIQNRVIAITNLLKVSPEGAKFYETPEISFCLLVEKLGYEFINKRVNLKEFSKLHNQLQDDKRTRIQKGYLFHFLNYPLELKKTY